MTVTVLLFASYADVLGRSALDVEVPDGATVGELLVAIGRMPGAERLPPRPLVAVNEEYAAADRLLAATDEIAIIPPVAGG